MTADADDEPGCSGLSFPHRGESRCFAWDNRRPVHPIVIRLVVGIRSGVCCSAGAMACYFPRSLVGRVVLTLRLSLTRHSEKPRRGVDLEYRNHPPYIIFSDTSESQNCHFLVGGNLGATCRALIEGLFQRLEAFLDTRLDEDDINVNAGL
jgi:hypothetical protein